MFIKTDCFITFEYYNLKKIEQLYKRNIERLLLLHSVQKNTRNGGF